MSALTLSSSLPKVVKSPFFSACCAEFSSAISWLSAATICEDRLPLAPDTRLALRSKPFRLASVTVALHVRPIPLYVSALSRGHRTVG